MGQDELPSGCGQSGQAPHRMPCLQSAPNGSGYRVLGLERQAVHRLGHQAARQGWGQGGLSYLAERGILPCRVGFSLRRLLSHPIRLRPAGRRETRLSTAGREVCLEIAKTSLFDRSLASSIAKLYAFVGFRVVPEVFSGRTDPKVCFGCIAHNLMHYSGRNL